MNELHDYAFPSDPAGYQPQRGLTKREYFAGVAMQGLLANQTIAQFAGADLAKAVTNSAVQYADALLAALNNPNER